MKNPGRRASKVPVQALPVKRVVGETVVRLKPSEPFQWGDRMYYVGKHGELRRLGK